MYFSCYFDVGLVSLKRQIPIYSAHRSLVLKDIVDQWVREVGAPEIRNSEDHNLVSDAETSDDACADLVEPLSQLFANWGLKLPNASKFKVSRPNANPT